MSERGPEDAVGPEDATADQDTVEPQDEAEPQDGAEPQDDVVAEDQAHDPVVDVRVRRALDVRRVLVSATSALCVLGLTAGIVLADDRLPGAERTPVAARVIEVPPAPTALVCPSPLRVPTEVDDDDDIAYDPQFDTAPADTEATLAAFVTGTADGALTTGTEGIEDGGPVLTGAVRTVTDPDAVTLRVPGGAEPVTTAATVVTHTPAGDLRGATAAPCTPPAAEHWIVGGSTALGSGARLVLQNPGRTAATVRVDVWGPVGALDLAGAPEFLVPPGQERVVLLEGVAAEQRRIVVRTTADGGLVHAYLQDSELRGLTPAGVALVTAGTSPTTAQVVSGIDVEGSEVGGTDTAVLRLLAPGAAGKGGEADDGEPGSPVDVQVEILGAEGPVDLPGVEEVRLAVGEVLDLPLDGLPAGPYAAVVRAEVPVAAGAMITRGESVGVVEASTLDPVDRAWLPAQRTAADGGAPGALVVPPVMPRSVVLTAPGPRTDAVVRVWDAEGRVTETDVTVPRHSTLPLAFDDLGEPDGPAPQVVEVIGDDVVWSVTLVGGANDGDHVATLTPPVRAPRQDRIAVDIR